MEFNSMFKGLTSWWKGDIQIDSTDSGSLVGIATGWAVRGSNPGGGKIFRTCPDRPWGPPSLLYNGYRVFSGGKERPGRDVNPSPASSAVGHERVDLYLYSPMGHKHYTEAQCLYKGAL